MFRANSRELRVLDFDIENRPLAYRGWDKTTSEVTAIAGQFIGQPDQWCWLLGDIDTPDMLREFRALYDQADVVTGHYIRGHDLPILNAQMVANGFDPLPAKLSIDTYYDLPRFKDLPKSQEYLSGLFGVPAPKVGVSVLDWERANRLTDDGRSITRLRVTADVTQHIQLLAALRKRKLLGPAKVWKP